MQQFQLKLIQTRKPHPPCWHKERQAAIQLRMKCRKKYKKRGGADVGCGECVMQCYRFCNKTTKKPAIPLKQTLCNSPQLVWQQPWEKSDWNSSNWLEIYLKVKSLIIQCSWLSRIVTHFEQNIKDQMIWQKFDSKISVGRDVELLSFDILRM